MKIWQKALLYSVIIYLITLLIIYENSDIYIKKPKYTPIDLKLFNPTTSIKKQPIVKKTKKVIKSNIKQKITRKPKIIKKPKITKITKKTKQIQKIKQQGDKPIQKETNTTKKIVKKELVMPSLDELNSLILNQQNIQKQKSTLTKDILDLYGKSINTLSPTSKEFLKNNLNTIRAITQSYLEFPQLAGELGLSGDTIVEFYLYPNGDISQIKLVKSSNYSMLDDNSIDTIQEAYKDYPHPKEKTLIRIIVKYINR